MSTRILLIAHAPLATALRDCALHVFPDCASEVIAIDVPAHEAPEDTLKAALQLLGASLGEDTLVLTDVLGATPANVAQRLVAGLQSRLIAGVNLPMLLRTVCYRHETLDVLTQRALSGGAQGVMQVACDNAPLST
ncbi:MAG: PTS fructose transporter subunit IIA [Betaproteobacteria bacterium]|nr:PTS fructose transporter subunit IIA [Betaproteobacteria bacterium]